MMRFIASVAVVGLVIAGPAAAQDSGTGQSAAVEAALSRVAPSLVRIHVVTVPHALGHSSASIT